MRLWKRSYLTPLVNGLICALVVSGILVLRARGYLQAAELKTYDILLNLRKPAAAPTPVVIVEITEPDIRAMARYPMTDGQLAELIRNIEKAGAYAIGVDVFRDIPVPGGTDELNRVLTSNPNVVMIWKYGQGAGGGAGRPKAHPPVRWRAWKWGVGISDTGVPLSPTAVRGALETADDEDEKAEDPNGVPPPPVLIDGDHPEYQARQAGLSDFFTDAGGIARRYLLYFDNEKAGDEFEAFPSLGMQMANLYLERAGKLELDPADLQHLEFWEKTVPRPFGPNDGGYSNAVSGGKQFLLDYRGAWAFPHFSVGQINRAMAGGPRRAEIAEALRGKIVFIGYTAVSTKDVFPTSLFPAQHGVKLHGIAADQLVRLATGSTSLTRVWGKAWEGAWTALWGVLGMLVGLTVRRPFAFTLVAIAGVAALAGLVYYAFLGGLWLPFVPPALAMLAIAAVVTSHAGLVERDNRGALMDLFAKHVSRGVAKTIWNRRDEFLQGGRLRSQDFDTVTVMFTDLQGFSTVSEQISAGLLMEWLNEYMEEMSALVNANGGVIVRFMGDALMAGFGVPVPSTTPEGKQQDATAAVRCALGMREAVARLNARFAADGRPAVRVRIGIHSGPAVVGSIGGRQRLEYTVLGDTVNTAARLEQYDKELMSEKVAADGCRILISENTQALTGGRFAVHGVGELKLHNKDRPINVFAVLDE